MKVRALVLLTTLGCVQPPVVLQCPVCQEVEAVEEVIPPMPEFTPEKSIEHIPEVRFCIRLSPKPGEWWWSWANEGSILSARQNGMTFEIRPDAECEGGLDTAWEE